MADEFIDSQKAARMMGKTRQWVAQLCRDGKLDCQRIANRWIIRRQSVLDYLAKQVEK